MAQNLIANASITIDASRAKVWNALVTPEAIKQYMFGTNVSSDWKEGSPITWSGEWEENRTRTRTRSSGRTASGSSW